MKPISQFSFTGPAMLVLLCLLPSLVAGAADLQLISMVGDTNSLPASANGDSYFPILGADGRYVLFASTANNLAPANHGAVSSLAPHWFNVYLQDRRSGSNTLVSPNLAGNGANWNSVPCAISTNGQFALFESAANDLVAGDSGNFNDVFVRDTINDTTLLVSVGTNGTGGNGASSCSTMTPDGRFVAFVSAARNLVPGDANGISDVFVRDLQAGVTTLVSAGAVPVGSLYATPNGSDSPVITPDGRYIAFYSSAKGLVPGVTLGGEVYVRDLLAGTTLWASTNARSLFNSVFGTTNATSCNQGISADGRFVVFEVCNSTISASIRGLVLRYDTQTHLADIVHTNANVPKDTSFAEIRTLDMTPDGRFITFVANDAAASGKTVIYLWDAQTGINTLVSADQTSGLPAAGLCESPVITPGGRYVAFYCDATNLTSNPLASGTHLYVHDLLTGGTRLIDVDTNGLGVGGSSLFSLSEDGRFVAFDSLSANLVPNDGNRSGDVFIRDLTTDYTGLISAHHPDLPAQTPNGFCKLFSTSVSTNGRFIAFTSDADNLVANDTNRCRDVFVSDLLLGTNFLVSVGANGEAALNSSYEPAISGDGRFVAFTSFATNLVPGGPGLAQNVFVRDLLTASTVLVSASTNGGFGDSLSYSPVISSDGNFVLFRSLARNLAYGPYPPISYQTENLFMRNSTLNASFALTTNGFWNVSMTPNGHYVAILGMNPSGLPAVVVWVSQTGNKAYTKTFSGGVYPSKILLSSDGRWLVYDNSGLYAWDFIGNVNRLICSGTSSFHLRGDLKFSAANRFLAFVTDSQLVAADTNKNFDVYLYDFQNNTNLLVSRSYNSTNAANGISDSPSLSPDGQFVAYRSQASNIVPNDTNHAEDVFLYDRVNGITTLVSVNQAGNAAANGCSQRPVFSGDGKSLVFQSFASDLNQLDFNEWGAIFQLNLVPPAVVDSDGDGMADQWELDHFGTLDRDGLGDFDGDGASDSFEFLTGTNPTDPNSKFVVTLLNAGIPGPTPAITWPVVSGKSYRVQFKENLADADWQDLNGATTLVGNRGQAVDLAPAPGQRFYRVVLNN